MTDLLGGSLMQKEIPATAMYASGSEPTDSGRALPLFPLWKHPSLRVVTAPVRRAVVHRLRCTAARRAAGYGS